MPSKNSNSKSLSLSNKSDKFFNINENTNNQKSDSLKYVRIFIIVIALNIFILNWLLKVHKCKCANIKEALYLKEWYMFVVTINIISFIMILFDIKFNNLNLIYFISLILTIVSFVMIIRLLIYISKLKKNNCDCGMTTQENIIYYWYIVGYSIILFFILLGFISFIISFINK